MTSTTPSLSQATSEFVDATVAFNRALACWWRLSSEDKAAVSERFWFARRDFNEAILEPAESRAS